MSAASPESPDPMAIDPGSLASVGQRAGAFLIDFAICFPLLFIPFLGSLVAMAYSILKDCLPFLDGQSVGKKLVGIRAVDEQGQSLSGNWATGVLRNVVFMIPFFGLVELVVLISRDDRRRFGDQWAKTVVVRADS